MCCEGSCHSEGTFWAHVEGGSGRSEASPTAILQDTHSVVGGFCEVRSMFVIVQCEKLHEALPRVYAAYTAKPSC
jgi:hypothetical protein